MWFSSRRNKEKVTESSNATRKPFNFSQSQRSILLENFSTNIYPRKLELSKIAKQIGVEQERVKVSIGVYNWADP